jgi:GTP-binding protein HflX
VALSSIDGEGFDDLSARLVARVDDAPEVMFRLAPSDGEAVAWLYRHGRVTGREETEEATMISARLDTQALGRFERMRPMAHEAPPAG